MCGVMGSSMHPFVGERHFSEEQLVDGYEVVAVKSLLTSHESIDCCCWGGVVDEKGSCKRE